MAKKFTQTTTTTTSPHLKLTYPETQVRAIQVCSSPEQYKFWSLTGGRGIGIDAKIV